MLFSPNFSKQKSKNQKWREQRHPLIFFLILRAAHSGRFASQGCS